MPFMSPLNSPYLTYGGDYAMDDGLGMNGRGRCIPGLTSKEPLPLPRVPVVNAPCAVGTFGIWLASHRPSFGCDKSI